MKRIVCDTNILISAFFWRGYPRDVYDLVRTRKVILLSSVEMEAEWIRVLAHPKFGLSSVEILPLVNNLRRYAQMIQIKTEINIITEDITDNVFLACAVDGKADHIISGDHHLLDVGIYEGIKIVKAKDFLLMELGCENK